MRELRYLKRGLLNENNGFHKNTLLFETFVFNLRGILMANHRLLQEWFLKVQACPAEGLLPSQEMCGHHLFKKANCLSMDRSGG